MHFADAAILVPTHAAFGEDIGTRPLPLLYRAGHHFLGVTETVDGCRVDPVDTEFEGAVNGGNRIIVVLRPPTKLPAAPPRAQAPKPTGVMSIFEFPSLRVRMTS